MRFMRAIAAACLHLGAFAQDSPTRPITIAVTYAPGGAADVVTRLILPEHSKALGQPMVVENGPGAGGNVGTDHVEKARKDGYTLVMGGAVSHAINVSLYRNPPYNAVSDLGPVSLVASLTSALVAQSWLPFGTLKGLLAHARSDAGKLSYALGGSGTTAFLAAEWFKSIAQIDMLHVPYRGGGTAMLGQLAGRVDLQFDLMTTALQNIRTGKLRAIGLPSARRSGLLPEFPTFAEAGVPGMAYSSWFALYATAGTPKDIVEHLNREVVKVLSMPEVKRRLLDNGTEATPSSASRLRAHTLSEIAKWAAVVRQSDARVK